MLNGPPSDRPGKLLTTSVEPDVVSDLPADRNAVRFVSQPVRKFPRLPTPTRSSAILLPHELAVAAYDGHESTSAILPRAPAKQMFVPPMLGSTNPVGTSRFNHSEGQNHDMQAQARTQERPDAFDLNFRKRKAQSQDVLNDFSNTPQRPIPGSGWLPTAGDTTSTEAQLKRLQAQEQSERELLDTIQKRLRLHNVSLGELIDRLLRTQDAIAKRKVLIKDEEEQFEQVLASHTLICQQLAQLQHQQS